MTPTFIDLESFWSPTHSLSKMNPIAYCQHADTEIQSCSIKIGKWPTDVVLGEDKIRHALSKIDWSDKWVIGHNMSLFDSMILAWQFGVKPAMWGCTLEMAMPLHGKTIGVSLGKLVEHYGVGVKNNTVLVATQGKRLTDFTPAELEAMRTYNGEDTDQCAELFWKLVPQLPRDYLRVIDMTIRMLTEPEFVLDTELLERTLVDVKEHKRRALLDLGAMLGCDPFNSDDETQEEVRAKLASAPQFKALIEQLGGECPMKRSPAKPDTWVPALAKTDDGMIEMVEHDNPVIAAAAAARLGVKSTQLETRIATFLESAAYCAGRLPVALKVCGAKNTWRWSGDFKMNQQNMPRIPRDRDDNIIPKNSNALRLSLKAPVGKKVVVVDKSGIEMRTNHFFWKVPSSMELFAQDAEADLYKAYAAARFNIGVDQVDKNQRQMGKVAQLQLGFQSGWMSLQRAAKVQYGLKMDDDTAKDVTYSWREQYPEIVNGWATCQNAVGALANKIDGFEIDPWGFCKTKGDRILTPNGYFLHYPGVRMEKIKDKNTGEEKMQWVYGYGRNLQTIYGGKLTENIIQHMAWQVFVSDALKYNRTALGKRFPMKLTVHDESVQVPDGTAAEDVLAQQLEIMRTPPTWWPELIVWAEGDIADTYGDAK